MMTTAASLAQAGNLVARLDMVSCDRVSRGDSNSKWAVRRAFRGSTSILALVLGSSLASPAFADSVYWNGPANGNWFANGNWVWDGHSPTAGDTATINTSTGPLIGHGLAGSASSLFVGTSSTGALTVEGTLATSSTLLGNSHGATGTVTVSGGWTNSGALYIGNEGEGTVSVTGGGSVSSGTTYLGSGLGGAGTLTVEGASDFTTSGFLYVGFAGTGGIGGVTGGDGTLAVTSGSLTSVGAVLADGIGTTGGATVSGSDGTWGNTGALIIGGGGIGSLAVTSGGEISNNGDTTIGNIAAVGTSTLTVSGIDSKLGSSGVLIVGNSGAASLSVDGQATVTSGGGVIGRHSTSSATVTGSGSRWTTGELLIGGDIADSVGTLGNGTLTVSGGGEVWSTAARLGDVAGASGAVIVDGATSKWTVGGGNLRIGENGTGQMTVRNGAKVNAAHAIIGANAGSDGTATIAGSGSTWSNSGNLYVGNGGDGTLNLQTGAKVTSAAGYVGTLSGSNSSVNISGSGSSWTMTDAFIAGYSSGTSATIALSGGGKISALQGTLGDLAGSSGTMTVNGSGSNWNAFAQSGVAYSGYMNVGRYGNGSLTVSNGGSVTAFQLYIGNEAGSTGTVVLTGSGSEIDVGNRLFIGANGGGALTLKDDSTLRAAEIRVAYGSGVVGTFNIGAASGQAAQSAGTIDASEIRFGAGIGKLVFNHTETDYTLASNVTGGGQVRIEGGVTTLSGANSYTGGTRIMGGTLIGTSGNSFGSGAIVNNSALVVKGSGKLSNNISGTGSLEKADPGVLTLSGKNSFTGGTTISGGTLVATTASLRGDVANYGTLVVDQNVDGTFAGDISGTGSLIKDGSGTVTLTGELTYSGTTTVRAGKLIGNTATVDGPVLNEGQLVFDQTFNGTYSSIISGSGSLLKTGSGRLTLTGANTYTGGTTISGGTLIGNADSFSTEAIINNASLIVNGSGTFANVMSGTGSFEKSGAGTLIMTGENRYTGPTLVSSGVLSVNGSLSGVVTVASGASLGGNGEIGGLTVKSGGTLSPGNSIGLLTVGGNASFRDGSTYAVEVDSAGKSDRLVAKGTVTIADDVTLNVTPENGSDTGATYALDTKYTILTASGGVTGTFDNVEENFAYLTAATETSDDQKAIYLTLTREDDKLGFFADSVSTANAKSAANAVEALGSGNALYAAALRMHDDETQSAFSQLSGELHASVGAALTDRSYLSRDIILGRLRNGFDSSTQFDPTGATGPGADSVAFWTSGFGGWSDYTSDGNGAAVDVSGGGVLFGVDGFQVEGWYFGAAGGYGWDQISEKGFDASADVDSYYVSAYGGTTIGSASLRLGTIHAFQTVDSKRTVSFSTLTNSLTANYNASTTQLFGEGSWRFDVDQTSIEPYANIAYVNTWTDDFAEDGGPAALSSPARHYEQVYSTIGLRANHDIALDNVMSRVSAGIGWRHAYGDTTGETALSFAGSDAFGVASTGLARDVLLLDLGVGFDVNERTNISLNYNAMLGEETSNHSTNAQLEVRF